VSCKVCQKPKPSRNKWFCSQTCSNTMPTNYWKGKTFPEAYRKKLSEAHKGKMTGEDHPLWKGESAGYGSKHIWMTRHFGQPSKCEFCKTTSARRFEWANISGKYLRQRADWVRLCKSCHQIYDATGYKSWATRRQNASA